MAAVNRLAESVARFAASTLGVPALVFSLYGFNAYAQQAGNQWVLDHFSPYYHYTSIPPAGLIITPSIVSDITLTQGCDSYCYDVWGGLPDEQVAFVNITNGQQSPGTSPYAASIHTTGNSEGWMDHLDTFLSNVSIAPMFSEFTDYQHTNYDGFTFDGGFPSDPDCLNDSSCYYGWPSHVYAENVTVDCGADQTCWSDAALDVKPRQLQAVNLTTRGHGLNTLKLWWPGPHYIVNSSINNDRYLNADPDSDGGLVWTWDCSKLHLIIYNSTFNGSSTLPVNKIGCQVAGTPNIEYRTVDPRTTGEMHPMFDQQQ